MKLFILFVVCVSIANTNATIFDLLKDQIQLQLNAIKRTKENIDFVIKNTLDTGSTAVKDAAQVIFDFSKVPPRGSVPDMIQEAGYRVESHYVTTKDGYILNIHRIPSGKTGKIKDKVVYLQHGIMTASSDWVLFGQQRGLAYILADEGYDVWMGNTRGSYYSRNHTVLFPDTDAEYWYFSWHEMGVFDLPTMIDYVLKQCHQTSLYYIGHSQGNTAFYVMASERPEYNKKIQAHISMAPIVYLEHTVSPLLQYLAKDNIAFGAVMQMIGQNEFLPNAGVFALLTEACGEGIGKVICKNFLFTLVGFSPKQMNVSDLSLVFANYPAGAATRQLVHYEQLTASGRFCKFDYGTEINKYKYQQSYPPIYNLYKVSAPVIIIHSSNDWLTQEIDLNRLCDELGNLKEKYLVPVPSWNHLDFIFGSDAPNVVYNKVLEFLDKY